jgi:hypothetical protein
MSTVLLVILGLSGLLMFARGWRGKLLDDHPLCRRCGFDLFGRPAGSNACSKCGADLAGPQAIVVGHRRRYHGLILLGGAIAILSVAIPVKRTVDDVRQTSLIAIEPVWRSAAPNAGSDRSRSAPAADARLV